MLPNDPMILLSYVNTKLRDFYANLDLFCQGENAEKEDILKKLEMIDYEYDPSLNRFV